MKTILTLCALAICGAFTLHAADAPKKGEGKPGEGKRNPEEMFKKLDTNGDGSVSKDEWMAGPMAKRDAAKGEERFKSLDKNGDGKLSLEEFKAGGGKKGGDAPKKPEAK